MKGMGAIWARVSTIDQAEMSLDNQVSRAKELIESAGYVIPKERILAVDWSSMDLFACPEFQKLRQWVQKREIQALGILNRDRLEANGLQRLIFLSDCKEAGIELFICQGPEILTAPEGQLVEMALALGKERSVLRARQGSKDGLHDKVTKWRLPVTKHKIFGYRWDGDRRLVPDDNWEVVKLIFDMAIAGSSYGPIILALKTRGILSPGGTKEFPKATISSIIHNPIYAGRYYGLKKRAVAPAFRKGKTYGNSSQFKCPFEEWVYLSEIEIVNPPITWEQHSKILNQLKTHQRLSRRNGKADYLLRGFIFCDTHRGAKGEPRRYHGQPHHGKWRYTCPVGGCSHQYINGPRIEELAKLHTRFLVNLQPDEFYESISDKRNRDALEKSLDKELRNLEIRKNKNLNAEVELENRSLMGDIDDEVYRRLKTTYRTQRKWIEDREESIDGELAQLNRQAEAAASLMEIQAKVRNRLDELDKTEWRELFEALNLELHVGEEATVSIWPADWGWEKEIPKEACGIEIRFGLPIERDAKRVGDIMFNLPVPG